MMDIKCDNCKQKSYVALYFYNPRIITYDTTICDGQNQRYDALVTGKAICPRCGLEIIKEFKKEVTKAEIIAIATGGKGID
jgi:PHP family Zn ribbon phosphoesterase